VFIEIEDDTGRKTILISRYGNEELYNKTKEIPPDSVIGIKASQYKGDLLIAKEIYLPDVTVNKTSLEEDIYAVFTSDLHIGSNKFIEDAFLSLIDILKGYTDDEKLKNIIKKIRYFVIAGDLVDGVGVFPNQESELLISDIKEQYNYAYNILKKIPGYIKIIIIPGNHDATRKALPQPPIRKEYADKFYDDKQFLMLGNPVNINLHGVNCYLYHGDFLQDMFTLIPEITQNDLNRAMRILLQVRHIAPTYGATTRIAAEKSDKLIIPEKLNIFHTGHIHRISIGRYKDILMINSGTWQLQTAYQKANGFSPTPGIVPIINLKDRSVLALNLLE
jgi:DNA polymerase II small subunit